MECAANMLSPIPKRTIVAESPSKICVQIMGDWMLNPVGAGTFTVDADKDGAVNVKEITKWLKECTKAGTCPEVTGEQVEASESE